MLHTYDTLDQLIQFAQLSANIHIHCHLSNEWLIHQQQQQGQGLVHIVTQGQSYLRLKDGSTQLLTQGDVIFFPMLDEHILSHHVESINLEHQTPLTQCELFCVQFSYAEPAQLIQSLPPLIHLKLDYKPLASLIHLFEIEQQQNHLLGANSVMNALSSVLLVQLIRGYLQHYQQHLTGLFSSLQHPKLGKLIHQLIQNPEHDWNIEQMADMTHLSRATFMRLFKQLMDISPYAFILNLRLQKSAHLLRHSAQNILSIALSTGFSSDTNFSKAFKKYYGCLPHEYRQQTQTQTKTDVDFQI
ncbi:helix-turn-helix domain-containing protein [Moraxella sp. ZY210820]|uniref:helix-turn-helix domain-containing protein n=1 Tax=unclassified Moraxella TaxID=2685852 RepID=UPI002730EDD2|nr:helix-turn-helix domain-containing protein [Moraxella sp. ZY210820]WLF83870.1 helix-turn-helix domain-containing protein [Moraxella sp. ZY210820]